MSSTNNQKPTQTSETEFDWVLIEEVETAPSLREIRKNTTMEMVVALAPVTITQAITCTIELQAVKIVLVGVGSIVPPLSPFTAALTFLTSVAQLKNITKAACAATFWFASQRK
jgi:hypothetical protein